MSTLAETAAIRKATERAMDAEAITTAPRVCHVPRGEGTAVWVAGDTHTFKAVSGDTEGRLFAWEAEVPPAPSRRTCISTSSRPTT